MCEQAGLLQKCECEFDAASQHLIDHQHALHCLRHALLVDSLASSDIFDSVTVRPCDNPGSFKSCAQGRDLQPADAEHARAELLHSMLGPSSS
jgi:hypothetical protein